MQVIRDSWLEGSSGGLDEPHGQWMVCPGFEPSCCWLGSWHSFRGHLTSRDAHMCSSGTAPGRSKLCPRKCECWVQKHSSKGGILIWIRAQGGGIIGEEIWVWKVLQSSEGPVEPLPGLRWRALATTTSAFCWNPIHHPCEIGPQRTYGARLPGPYHCPLPRLRLPGYMQDTRLHLSFG